MNRTCRSLALLAALLALPRARCDGAQAAAPSAPPVAALAGCTPAAAVPERALLQWGEPRSASTWQTRLLALLGRVRAAKACLPYCVEAALEDPLGDSGGGYMIADLNATPWTGQLLGHCPPGCYCVFKAHHVARWSGEDEAVVQNRTVLMFRSLRARGSLAPRATHLQVYEDLLEASTFHNVKVYAPIFGLSDGEVLAATEYLSVWSILRKCCGLQSSVEWMYELHHPAGAPHPRAGDRLDYPNCGLYDLAAVERRLGETRFVRGFPVNGVAVAVPLGPFNGSYCAATIATVARGAGFNGRAANLKAELKLSAEPVVAKKPAGNRG